LTIRLEWWLKISLFSCSCGFLRVFRFGREFHCAHNGLAKWLLPSSASRTTQAAVRVHV
jgi:hypothetical protein